MKKDDNLQMLFKQMTALEAKFTNPELSQDDINKLSEKLQKIIDTIGEKEIRWFELSEKLED